MKTDDDAFVRIDEVLSSLKGKDPNGLLYGGISFESTPHRDKENKWYISPEVFISKLVSSYSNITNSLITVPFCRNIRLLSIPHGHMDQVILFLEI